jgi:hypothetical protein
MKKQIRHFLSVFLVVCIVSFLAEPALAEVITFNFTGTVTYVTSPPPYGMDIANGDPVTGSIAYDPSLPPTHDTGSVAGYIQQPPSGMVVVIGDATVQSTGNASLQVLDNAYGVDNLNGFFTPTSVNDVPQSGAVFFYLADTSQTVFSSTDLPDSLDIASFNIHNGTISAGTGITVSFSIDSLEKAAIPVKIDIKPGSFPNSINPNNQGVIPVAILTTDSSDNVATFDASSVDPATILFGPAGTEAVPVHDDWEDVDGDGDIDMILHLNTQDTNINCGDTSVTLTGETFDGQSIKGIDSIRTVGCQ